MKCRRCGAEIDTRRRRADGSVQCPKCGVVYRPRATSQSSVKRSVAKKSKQPSKKTTIWDKIKSLPWRKRYWKLPLWAWVGLVIVLIGGIGLLGDDSSKNDIPSENVANSSLTQIANVPATEIPFASDVPAQAQVIEESPEPTEEVIDDPLSYAAEKVFKDEYAFELQNANDVYIRFRIDGSNAEWTLKDFKNDVTNYCKMLSTQFPDTNYGTLYFVGYCATVDVYGQQGFQDAVRLAIDKDAVEEVVWENFLFENIDQIGHDYVVGALLQS